ncbi:MAG: efflux RND transporter periplasmic adaptor subunit [Methylocystis sp.]
MSPPDGAPPRGGSGVGPAWRWRETSKARLFGLATLLLVFGAFVWGAWSHYEQRSQAVSDAKKRRGFIPTVRVEDVRESESVIHATWPGATLAYEQANLYARATGYISTRNVDIGSSKLFTQDSVSKQQADNDRLTYASEKASTAVAEANVVAQQAAVDRLVQLTSFERVTAPFDGTVTARFIDVGALVQADDVSGTFLFTMMHGDVIRIQTYVPQDQAFGLTAGVEAVIGVPEIPKRNFPGKVTMVAGALAPGTRTLLAEIDVPNPDGVDTVARRGELPALDQIAFELLESFRRQNGRRDVVGSDHAAGEREPRRERREASALHAPPRRVSATGLVMPRSSQEETSTVPVKNRRIT